jgi:hypothetical protein
MKRRFYEIQAGDVVKTKHGEAEVVATSSHRRGYTTLELTDGQSTWKITEGDLDLIETIRD